MDPKNHEKTALTSHNSLFKFTTMAFVLRNAPATFKRAMDAIFLSVKWKSALVYLDDTVVFSKIVEVDMLHLRHLIRLVKGRG